MPKKLAIRIETSRAAKSLLPWIAVQRPGRQRVDSSCFALAGYPEAELASLDRRDLEHAREALEYTLRLLSAFEYIPRDDQALEEFFEKKIIAFEDKIRGLESAAPPLHAVLGVVCGSKILFAASGDILILHAGGSSILNLGDTRGGDELHFNSLQSGTLGQKSFLLIIPKSIGTIFKSEELKQLASARTSERKLEFLERLWLTRTIEQHREEFRALIIETKPKLTRPEGSTAVSIAHLLDTEAQTEEMLSPPLLRPFLKYLRSMGLACGRYAVALVKQSRLYIQRNQSQRSASTSPPALSPILKHASVRARNYFAKFSAPRPDARNISGTVKQLLRSAQLRSRLGGGIAARFNQLTLKSKAILFLLITFVFLFIQGILITNQRANIHAATQSIVSGREEIQMHIDAANSALIYENERAAREHVKSAGILLEEIIARDDRVARDLRPDFLALKNPLDNLRARLRHEITVGEPALIDAPTRDALLLEANPVPAAFYGTRRYELRADQNQVLRREKSGGEFDAGSPWIQDGADVRDAVSIAIDGAIYAGMRSGTVARLLKGRKAEFSLPPVDPPLNSMVKLWTDENSDYLYVLDAQEKRLLAFTKKDGLLKAQYFSPAFTDLKDFKIDESKKTAYLLDGTNTVSIPLSHL